MVADAVLGDLSYSGLGLAFIVYWGIVLFGYDTYDLHFNPTFYSFTDLQHHVRSGIGCDATLLQSQTYPLTSFFN